MQLTKTSIIAKHFQTTPDNIRKTYRDKKPDVFRVIDIGSYILESGISLKDLKLHIDIIKAANDKED